MIDIERHSGIINIILFYFLFLLLNILNKIPSVVFSFTNNFPNFELFSIFYFFLFSGNNSESIYFHLFIFGIIIDIFNFIPLGASSLALILDFRIIFSLKKLFAKDNNFIYFLRDIVIFFINFFILQWFILSIYDNKFINITPIILLIIRNLVFFNIIYFIYLKVKK